MKINKHKAIRFFFWIFFIFMFFFRFQDVPRADEIDFLKPMDLWVQHGPQEWGVWHVPFYPHLLSLIGYWLWPAASLYRIPGLFSLLIGVFFIIKTFDLFFEKEERLKTILTVWTLFLPITLSSALILDHDNTLLVASTAVFFFFTLKLKPTVKLKKNSNWFFSAMGLALCFLSKETTPLAYPLLIFLVTKDISKTLKITLTGILFFLGISKIWFWIYDIPFFKMFEFTILGLKINLNKSGAPPIAGNFIHEFTKSSFIRAYPWIWVSPFFLFLLFRMYSVLKNQSLRALYFTVLAVLFVYSFLLSQKTYYYPKYMVPVLVWLPFLVIVSFKKEMEKLIKTKDKLTFPITLALFLLISILANPMQVLYFRNTVYGIYYCAILGGIFLASYFRLKNIISAMIICSFGGILFFTLASFDRSKSITYWFGEENYDSLKIELKNLKKDNPDLITLSPARDLSYALRDLDVQYKTIPEIYNNRAFYCSKNNVVFLSRVREENSILKNNFLQEAAKCFRIIPIGHDYLIAMKRS